MKWCITVDDNNFIVSTSAQLEDADIQDLNRYYQKKGEPLRVIEISESDGLLYQDKPVKMRTFKGFRDRKEYLVSMWATGLFTRDEIINMKIVTKAYARKLFRQGVLRT